VTDFWGMRHTTRHKLFAISAFLVLMGCTSTKKPELKVRPSLTILNSTSQDPEELADLIVKSLSSEQDPKKALTDRLDNIFNPKIREGVILPLYDLLGEQALKEVLIEYYVNRPIEVFGDDFVGRVLGKNENVSGFLEMMLASGTPKGRLQIENYFKQKTSLSQLEMLQFSEILLDGGKFSESARVLAKVLYQLEGEYLARGEFASAELDFYQKDYAGAVEKLVDYLPQDRYREESVDMLVDGLILMDDLNKAFRYLKVYATYKNDDEPKIHVLRGKLFLFAKNYRESHKQWARAKDLGSRDEQYWLLSFFLSHYFPEGIPDSDMGPFLAWHKGRLSGTGLDLVRYDIYLDQYQKLSRHKQELVPRLRPFSRQTP